MIKINLQRFAVPEDIMLGDGVFYIGIIPVALTRGGGAWKVARQLKLIEADGDRGPVKGRIRKVESIATLTLNALELLPANLPRFYPATDLTSSYGVSRFTEKEDIEDGDYQDEISFVGVTLDGRSVTIVLENAINLEDIDWALVDKDEVVPEITYTATYLEATRTTAPWYVDLEE